MTEPRPAAERRARALRAVGWALLAAALLPVAVSHARSHARLLEPTRHEPAVPDWVRYDALTPHLAELDRVHLYTDAPDRIALLKRFDLQFAVIPRLIWADPPGRAAVPPPDARTGYVVDAADAARADALVDALHAAAARDGWHTHEQRLDDTLRLLRFTREDSAR